MESDAAQDNKEVDLKPQKLPFSPVPTHHHPPTQKTTAKTPAGDIFLSFFFFLPGSHALVHSYEHYLHCQLHEGCFF